MGAAAVKLHGVVMYPRVYMTVEPILLVFMFAQFLSYSMFQQMLHAMVCENNPDCIANASMTNTLDLANSNQSDDSCSIPSSVEEQVQTETSHWLLYVNVALGLPSIFISLFYGSISDQMGRKLFIFLPALGAALNTGIILEVAYLQDVLPFYLFLIGAFLAGLYGSYPVLNFAVYSYVSDVTAHSGRTCHIGILESMTYIGATLSLLVGGLWLEKAGSFIPAFWCVLTCHLAVIAYTLIGLPESMQFSRNVVGERNNRSIYNLKYSRSHKISSACARFINAIGRNISGFIMLLATNWRISLLLLVFFVVEINFLGIVDVVILFTLRRPLCWDSKVIGYFLALKVFLNGLATLFIVPLLSFMLVSDAVIILIGLISGAISLILMGLAQKTWIMFLVPIVSAMRGAVVPCLRSMISKQVPSDKQGIVFSSLAVVESTCTLLASVIYNSIYPLTYTIHPGMCFFIMAAGLVVPFVLILFLYITRNSSFQCRSSHRLSRATSPLSSPSVTIETKPLLQ